MPKPLPKGNHGRKPPPPVRTGPTRSTFDSCPGTLMLFAFVAVIGLAGGAGLVILAFG